MKRFCPALVLATALWSAAVLDVAGDSGAVSPHDNAHLVVLRPSDFHDSQGKSPAHVKDRGTAFDAAVPLTTPLQSALRVRHPGKYNLWVRLGVLPKTAAAVDVTLLSGARQSPELLRGTIGDGKGSVERGGPDGYDDFARKAKQKGGTFKDVVIDPNAKKDGAASKDLDDLEKELRGEKPGQSPDWIHPTRLEQIYDARPFYWWKVGKVELSPGDHQLRVAMTGKVKPDTVLLDAAFLTTADQPAYPYVGDINAPRSSYVRFRIDRLPKTGLQIGANLRIHSEPWNTPRVWLNPTKINTVKAEAHTKAGYTRWYRLQDIERCPAFGATQAHLLLHIDGKADVPPTPTLPHGGGRGMGATQFAVLPHQDYVLREIDWAEPEGLSISMAMDFETHLHALRTLRDHAREHYEKALSASGGNLFPLTRGDLYFGNSWGGASGECVDYMNKTLRLLGFNSVGASSQPVKYRELYGWTNSAGHYWPPAHLPFDEDETRRQYDAYYKDWFSKQQDFYRGVTIFQIADEPGEISRPEMTAPLWRFMKDPRGDKWADLAGNSELATRRVDLHDCVLEGKVEKHGTWFGFRIIFDSPNEPKQLAYWHIGLVSQNRENNLAAGRSDRKQSDVALRRPGAIVGNTPTAFKIIYQGNSAALFLNGKLIHQHTDLPAKGGFGFTGAPKAISELRLRTIRKDERLAVNQPDGTAKDPLADLDDLTGKSEPEWAKAKPLEKFVMEDWVVGGGIARAHTGFRRWVAAQGLEPSLFGKKTWDEVRMLTVPELVRDAEEARLFYWSRRYSGYLTPRMFNLAADAIHKHAPNQAMRGFVALSGHSLYFPSHQPLDMFQLAHGSAMMPGISDWMSLGSWFWDSHQAVAFSIAPYNAGARRYGQEPINYPMMHCVGPSTFRSYTMLANNVKHVSFYNFGPSYAVTEGFWSEDDGCYHAVHRTNNHAAQLDDVLAPGRMRPSRVAMLYSVANEYWNAASSFADKRAGFLALSHEYFQPELVTEQQVQDGALKHYDALYVLDPVVPAATQDSIAAWVRTGGLLWTCADALTKNEYNEGHDLLSRALKIERCFETGRKDQAVTIKPEPGTQLRSHPIVSTGKPAEIKPAEAKVLARYDDGQPAWLEMTLDKGKVVYVGHRVGLTYAAQKVRPAGYHTVWADTSRPLLTQPLHAHKVERELVLSQPVVMALPLSTNDATVVVLYNMRPAPCKDLVVTLKEPAKPHSVEAFVGDRLKPLPFEYRDGKVWTTLPELSAEQMVLVRRKPAPADERLAELHKRVEQQLMSSDAATLSAGAWFAGFHPEWQVTDRLLSLLSHKSWEVRRAAAEALGKRGDASAGDRLVSVLRAETDSHVLGDAIVAIARLGHTQTGALVGQLVSHKDAWVRGQAVHAATLTLTSGRPNVDASKWLTAVMETGLRDPDRRVRRPAIDLAARLGVERSLQEALSAFASPSHPDQADWAQAIADNDDFFRAYVKCELPGGNGLLVAVAARRADSTVARALTERLGPVVSTESTALVRAALQQRHPALARKLFAERKTLPAVVNNHLTLILEYTFAAGLGNSLTDWDAWLEQAK